MKCKHMCQSRQTHNCCYNCCEVDTCPLSCKIYHEGTTTPDICGSTISEIDLMSKEDMAIGTLMLLVIVGVIMVGAIIDVFYALQ